MDEDGRQEEASATFLAAKERNLRRNKAENKRSNRANFNG